MKILVITQLYPTLAYRASMVFTRAVHDLVRKLPEFGINVDKVIRPINLREWPNPKANNIHIKENIEDINIETRSFRNVPVKGFILSSNDYEYFDKNVTGIDMVVAHMYQGASIAYQLFKLYGIPYIYVLHSGDFLKFQRYKHLINNAQAVFTRSIALSRQLEQKGYKSDGIVFSGIPSSLIIKSVKPIFKTNSHPLSIISVNKLQKLKNIDITLCALSELVDLDWNYTIIGEGEEFQSIASMIKSLGLTSRVKMLGEKDNNYCLAAMRESDVFVMPSAPETFGYAYLEALAAGCIVIGAKGWGIDGVVIDGHNGYLVDPRSIKDLKHTFLKIFSFPQKEIQINALMTIRKYSEERAQEQYAHLIKRYLNKLK